MKRIRTIRKEQREQHKRTKQRWAIQTCLLKQGHEWTLRSRGHQDRQTLEPG